MQNTYLDPGRQLSNEDHTTFENISSSEPAKKRKRCRQKSPDLEDSKKEGKAKKQKEKKPVDSANSFGCPFYKSDPVKYGGENGCSSWGNPNIETVIRVSFPL